MIEAQKAQEPVRIINLSLRIPIPFQHRHQIGQGVFDPVNFPGAECGCRGAAIWNPDQFQPVKMHTLAAGSGFGGFVTRHVSLIPRIMAAAALHIVTGNEAPWPAADHVFQAKRPITGITCNTLRHHEAGRSARFGQSIK